MLQTLESLRAPHRPLRAVVAVAAIVTVLAGCGGSDDRPVATTPATDAAEPLECTDAAAEFSTSLDSCEEAIAQGSLLAAEFGLTTDSGTSLIFSTVCEAIQGHQPTTYSTPEYLELATQLDESGVCPGDVLMLIRAG